MREGRTDVQAVKERIDVAAVMSRYLSLVKSGQTLKGRCPFHKDDTPSFVVSPEKGLWHCFGCGEGGDLFAFLMKIERISFPEALEKLAAEAGVVLKRRGDGERDELFAITAQVAALFSENLHRSAEGEKARQYLLGRGFAAEAWERFGLGYALPGWDHVKGAFAKRYGTKVLTDLGLLVESKGTFYDRFRDRVIFPIVDLTGRPVAFGGRAFDGEPKYLNSPKTPLFDKGRTLYGLSWAREAISAGRSAVLVEGYTDVLSLHLAGIPHAVGSMGTSLTQGQADLLARFADEAVIAYDRDAAGGAGALRGMTILRNSGLSVRVARFPEGDDPDSLVRREGPARVNELVAAAVPFHLFYLDSLKDRHDLHTHAGKEGTLEEARPFYQGVASLPLRQEIAGHLAGLVNLPLERVMEDLASRPSRQAGATEPSVERREWGEQEVMLALMLRGRADGKKVFSLVSPEAFSEAYRPIAEAMARAADPADLAALMVDLDEESARLASYLTLAPVEFSDAEKALDDALAKLVTLPAIERRLADVREEMKRTEASGDRTRIDELQGTYRALVVQKLSRRKTDGNR